MLTRCKIWVAFVRKWIWDWTWGIIWKTDSRHTKMGEEKKTLWWVLVTQLSWEPREVLMPCGSGARTAINAQAAWLGHQHSESHLSRFNQIIGVYIVTCVWNCFQICDANLGMKMRLRVLWVIQLFSKPEKLLSCETGWFQIWVRPGWNNHEK